MLILVAGSLLLCASLLLVLRRRGLRARGEPPVRAAADPARAQGAALLESEAGLRGILENAPAAIALKSLEGRFLMVNPRMQALLGRAEADILGRTLEDFYPAEAAARIQEREQRVLGLRQPMEQEEQLPEEAEGGPRDYLSQRFPLVDALGHCWGLGVIHTDITERKRASLAILQHQKNEFLSRLAGGFAHDFNNLLGAMQANLELARLELPDPAAVPDHLGVLEDLVDHAGQLVLQMLSIAGQGPSAMRPLNLNQVLEELIHLLRSSLPGKTALRYDPEPDLPLLEADPSQINQLIINLVLNAAEAMPAAGGSVTLRTGQERLDAPYIASVYPAQGLEPGPYVSLEVTDTGRGVTAEIRQRMFDPFFSTKLEGRGLGLSAALGIVRGHGGGIRVYSQAGQGTQVKVVLPAVGAASPVPAEPVAAPAEFRGAGTVLVVDDDDRMRMAAVKLLNHIGFDTLQARDGLEALHLLEQQKERIQLVLMDLSMPRMNGEEAYRELRQRGILVPVILSSGFQEREALLRFRGQGLAGFLQKPYKHNVILKMLREILEPQLKE